MLAAGDMSEAHFRTQRERHEIDDAICVARSAPATIYFGLKLRPGDNSCTHANLIS